VIHCHRHGEQQGIIGMLCPICRQELAGMRQEAESQERKRIVAWIRKYLESEESPGMGRSYEIATLAERIEKGDHFL